MNKITVFNLDAVIRYSQEDSLSLLAAAIHQEVKVEVDLSPYDILYSYRAKVKAWFKDQSGLSYTDDLEKAICKHFHKSIKKLFLKDEEAFEIRPGVQSVFSKLESEKKWKFGITSPLWRENTKFILESCGVFSKTKLTVSIDDAEEVLAQIDLLSERSQKKDQSPEIEIVCIGKAGKFKKEGYKVLKPKSSKKEHNFYYYPKFQEFFGKKEKKKSKSKNKEAE